MDFFFRMKWNHSARCREVNNSKLQNKDPLVMVAKRLSTVYLRLISTLSFPFIYFYTNLSKLFNRTRIYLWNQAENKILVCRFWVKVVPTLLRTSICLISWRKQKEKLWLKLGVRDGIHNAVCVFHKTNIEKNIINLTFVG